MFTHSSDVILLLTLFPPWQEWPFIVGMSVFHMRGNCVSSAFHRSISSCPPGNMVDPCISDINGTSSTLLFVSCVTLMFESADPSIRYSKTINLHSASYFPDAYTVWNKASGTVSGSCKWTFFHLPFHTGLPAHITLFKDFFFC